MRSEAIILILALAVTAVQGYPLIGSNGDVDCVVFGVFKEQFNPGDVNAGKNALLEVDSSLISANTSGLINASYTLVDGNDRVYSARRDYRRDLQPSRRILGFIVPKEALAKKLLVEPTNSNLGPQFSVDLQATINASAGPVKIVYYGPIGSKEEYKRKTLNFDVGVTNNGTKKLQVSSSNFTLQDQWGWNYSSSGYNRYNGQGFARVELKPNETVRSGLTFAALSPLSRPSKLVYSYSKNDSVAINIDETAGYDLSANADSKGCCGGGSPAEAAPTTLSGSIKATKARLAKVKSDLGGIGK
jgi:hypothetical protein